MFQQHTLLACNLLSMQSKGNAKELSMQSNIRDVTTTVWCTGAANAGVPLSIIVKNHGWNAYFTALLAACGMAILLLAPMVNLKSYVQREALAKSKAA